MSGPIVNEERPANRTARETIEKSGRTIRPSVRFVMLRRRQGTQHTEGKERADFEYSCQWIVGGHWQNQWYPSKGIHQPVWISPYRKGPEDKPFKGGERVFLVKR
jgi:hypothetical protein